MTNKLLGILGGTFDPIHLGHLQIARNLTQQAQLSAIKIIPCYQSPHRQHAIANAQHRTTMIKLALAEDATKQHHQDHQSKINFELDEREINKPQISYTVTTLEELHQEQEKQKVMTGTSWSLCLIIGADVFAKFHLWHRWQRILQLCHLIVVARPNLALPQLDDAHNELNQKIYSHIITEPSELRTKTAGLVWFATINPIAIAATTIRNTIKDGKSAAIFLPMTVWKYIVEHNLYR